MPKEKGKDTAGAAAESSESAVEKPASSSSRERREQRSREGHGGLGVSGGGSSSSSSSSKLKSSSGGHKSSSDRLPPVGVGVGGGSSGKESKRAAPAIHVADTGLDGHESVRKTQSDSLAALRESGGRHRRKSPSSRGEERESENREEGSSHRRRPSSRHGHRAAGRHHSHRRHSHRASRHRRRSSNRDDETDSSGSRRSAESGSSKKSSRSSSARSSPKKSRPSIPETFADGGERNDVQVNAPPADLLVPMLPPDLVIDDENSPASEFTGGWSSEDSFSSISAPSSDLDLEDGEEIEDIYGGELVRGSPVDDSPETGGGIPIPGAKRGSDSRKFEFDLRLDPPGKSFDDLTGSSPGSKQLVKRTLSRSNTSEAPAQPPLLKRSSSSVAEMALGMHVSEDPTTGDTFLQAAAVRHVGGIISGRAIDTLDARSDLATPLSVDDGRRTVLSERFIEFVDMVLYTFPYFTTQEALAGQILREFSQTLPLDLSHSNAKMSPNQVKQFCRLLVFLERWAEVHFELMLIDNRGLSCYLNILVTLRDQIVPNLDKAGLEDIAKLARASVRQSLSSIHRHMAALVRAKAGAESVSVGDLVESGSSSFTKKDKKSKKSSNSTPVQTDSPVGCLRSHDSNQKQLQGLANILSHSPNATFVEVLDSPLVLESVVRHEDGQLLKARKISSGLMSLHSVIKLAFLGSEAVDWVMKHFGEVFNLASGSSGSSSRALAAAMLAKRLALSDGDSFEDKNKAFVFRSTEISRAPRPSSDGDSSKESKKEKKKSVDSDKEKRESGRKTPDFPDTPVNMCSGCSLTLFGCEWHPGLVEVWSLLRPSEVSAAPTLGVKHRLSSGDSARVDWKALSRIHKKKRQRGSSSRAIAAVLEDLEEDEFLCASCGRISGPPTDPMLPKGFASVSKAAFDLFTVHPSEFARQLTVVDAAMFASVHLDDFRKQAWNKKPEGYKPKPLDIQTLHEQGETLRHWIEHINRISYWVATELVTVPTHKMRLRAAKFFIMAAQYCLRLNNYSSVFAILNGLQHLTVERIKTLWQDLPTRYLKVFKSLQNFTSESGSNKRYRRELADAIGHMQGVAVEVTPAEKDADAGSGSEAEAMRPRSRSIEGQSTRGAARRSNASQHVPVFVDYHRSESTEPLFGSPALCAPYDAVCVIPYVAVDLRDLTLIEECNDTLIEHKDDADSPCGSPRSSPKSHGMCLNFEKMRMIAKVLKKLHLCQVECREVVSNIATVPEIQNQILYSVHGPSLLTPAQLYSFKVTDVAGGLSGTIGRRFSSFLKTDQS